MAEQYPPAVPYQSGMLDAGDKNLVYWEMCGNPGGTPALVVHGRPGFGLHGGAAPPVRWGAIPGCAVRSADVRPQQAACR